MRILFVSQLLPSPLDAGPKIRAHYVLRHLAESGHQVSLLCFVRPDDSREDILAVARYCDSVEPVLLRRSRVRDVGHGLASLAGHTPFLIRRDRVPEMTNRLAEMCRQGGYDAIHADQLWMAEAVAVCPASGLRVLDQHNAVFRVPKQLAESHSSQAMRLWLRSEANKLEQFEKRIVHEFDRVVWVNPDDRHAVLNGHGTTDTHGEIIPIAIDPHTRMPLRRSRAFRVTFLGGLHWPPNAEGVRWFANQVWPTVSADAPNAVFTVIGRDGPDTSAIRTAGSRIEVTGHVSDPTRLLEETAVFVVPLRSGAGMRVKVLDAWSWALPVVSTTVGVEGIRAVHDANALVADTPEAFATEVLRVLQDSRLADRLAGAGRATVEASYDWRKVYQAWNRVYR